MGPNKINKLFGTDGIRGEAGKFPLDAVTIRVLGKSLARRLAERTGRNRPRIIIGRDTRESGPWIERELINGISSAQAEVLSAGVITTPGVAFLARSLPADAGIVISASHNPFQDNGIKIFDPSGRKLDDQTERLIEADIHAATDRGVDASSLNNRVTLEAREAKAFQSRYVDYLAREVGNDLSVKGLTIVVDCANGAAFEIAPQLFERLGARVIAINNEPDGRNINLDCGSLHLDLLRRVVVAEGADLGVAFDGDADRALFVDLNGNLVDGDATLWIMASYMQSSGALDPNSVVATVMSNIGLEIALQSRGIKLIRTDVGDKYVLEELLGSGAKLGGEQSGHIIFPKLSLAGDGLITTLQLLRAMRDTDRSLPDLTKGFHRYPQVLVNVRVSNKKPFDELPSVKRQASETERKLGDRGRLLLRYSGTEPLARVMIEGERQEEIDRYAAALADTIRSALDA
ncbi:MAG TPA: phosphoglucosamine mutase [Pyrinomonadaceae bacterium]|nr:phosphoglucosamine mutase [Pyrinomonadaceae bacterium]